MGMMARESTSITEYIDARLRGRRKRDAHREFEIVHVRSAEQHADFPRRFHIFFILHTFQGILESLVGRDGNVLRELENGLRGTHAPSGGDTKEGYAEDLD